METSTNTIFNPFQRAVHKNEGKTASNRISFRSERKTAKKTNRLSNIEYKYKFDSITRHQLQKAKFFWKKTKNWRMFQVTRPNHNRILLRDTCKSKYGNKTEIKETESKQTTQKRTNWQTDNRTNIEARKRNCWYYRQNNWALIHNFSAKKAICKNCEEE